VRAQHPRADRDPADAGHRLQRELERHVHLRAVGAGRDNGKVRLHTSGGDADELNITQISIMGVNSVPAANGPQDIILVYVRD
jgi:hypothetical protein